MAPKAQRQTQIKDAAAKLFRDSGYAGASMKDIASSLGMEAPSLYNHFKSKEDIVIDICFDMADRFLSAIDEVNDIYFNAEEKLRMAVKNHVEILTSDIEGSFVFLREWRHLPPHELTRFKELRKKYEDGFRQILIDGENENLFKMGDRDFAVLTILSSLNWIVEWYNPKASGKSSPEEIANRLTDFILSGLKKELPHSLK